MNQLDDMLYRCIEEHLERKVTRTHKRRLTKQQIVRLMVYKRADFDKLIRNFKKGTDKILEEFIDESTNF